MTGNEPSIVSFTSDFGDADGWTGVCRGVMLAIEPRLLVIDVAHGMPPFDLRHAAVVLAASLPVLPSVVDLAVVDPGVGTSRRRAVVRAGGHLLVGPDNGLFAAAIVRLGGADAAWEISDPRWWGPVVSMTFEARDIFAPVAARLAAGLEPGSVGPPVDPASLAPVPWRAPELAEEAIRAEVVSIDRFGSVRLGVDASAIPMPPAPALELVAPAAGRAPVVRTFGDVEPGALAWLVDSSGFWTLVMREGSAALALGLSAGQVVEVAWQALK